MICAAEFIEMALNAIQERASLRDSESGERSMATIAEIYNAATGSSMTERQGWLMMISVKLGRMAKGRHHADDYTDLIGYAALAGECAEREAHS